MTVEEACALVDDDWEGDGVDECAGAAEVLGDGGCGAVGPVYGVRLLRERSTALDYSVTVVQLHHGYSLAFSLNAAAKRLRTRARSNEGEKGLECEG